MVEWYSIDECFADITGLDADLRMSYEDIAKQIQETLYNELGITFSVGLSTSKVLAKVASKWKKPNGRTIIPLSKIGEYLRKVPLVKYGVSDHKRTVIFLGLELRLHRILLIRGRVGEGKLYETHGGYLV